MRLMVVVESHARDGVAILVRVDAKGYGVTSPGC